MAKWLYAAELLKHHDGGFADWSQEAKKIFDEEYVRKLLVPLSLGWPGNIDPYACQNQYVYVADARMALGIYLDDKALFNSGYHYLTKKNFICSLNQEIFGHDPASMLEYVIGPNGQFMEINRDMGHTKMCMTATMQIAEMLWSQGYDLYGTILYGDTTPRYYQGMRWLVKGKFDKVESYLRGAQKLPSIGPYEKYYNHFRYRLKNKYPVPADLERYVFEQRKSGNYNDFLYMELDNKTLPEAPSDLLAASPVWYQVELSWKDNAL